MDTKNKKNKEEQEGNAPKDKISQISEAVLKTADKILPGLHGLFKKGELSKTFGSRLKEIRKEIERKFAKTKK